MSPIVSLWTAALATLSSVTGLSVVPVEDRTEVVIEIDGPVSIEHFTLEDPHRLVVDLTTAREALARSRFDAIRRGGVRAVRVGQFRPEIVRVVVDLEQPVDYSVVEGAREIRLSFKNPAGSFEPWRSAPAASANLPEFAAVAGSMASAAGVPALDARAPMAGATAGAARFGTGSVVAPVMIPPEDPPMNIMFRDADIRDVLATFAEHSGRTIIAGQGVTGTVTADIRDQPWEVALEALLAAYGFAAEETESGIIRVDKLSALRQMETEEPFVTRKFQIKYARADTALVGAISGLLSGEGASVTVSAATNTIIVRDRQSVLEEQIAPIIEQLDVRTPQVSISAKILFVDRTSLEELGIIYDIKDSRGNQINRLVPGGIDLNGDNIIAPDEQTSQTVVRLGGSSIGALANANFRPANPALEVVTSLLLGRHSLITFIDALSSLEYTSVEARPTIMTMDHIPARVQVGERTPIRVVDAGAATAGGGGGGGGGPAGVANAPRATVSFEDTGIILEVTPHVTGNQVLLELHAERSNVALAPSDIGFTFQKQATDTQILLNDGETGVISGMTITEKSEVRAGIPILKDLPLIGALFRSTSEQENKLDLLIMVTPHIIREGEA